MTGRDGHYIESETREYLKDFRRISGENFRYMHIKGCLQCWDDVVLCDVLYPPDIKTKRDFRIFNNQFLKEIK